MTDRPQSVRLVAAQGLVLVGRLREAWPWLVEAVTPGPTAYVERQMSATARARLNRLVNAERAERVFLVRAGLTPAPPTPAPARIAVIDAQVQVLRSITDVAWLFSSALHRRDGYGFRAWGRDATERVTARKTT